MRKIANKICFSFVGESVTKEQAVTTCWSVGAGLRGNGERMRKLRGNGKKMRKLRGNGERMRKWRENEEMERK